MSMHETVEVTCPKCGKVSPFVIWSSINTQLDPEMKEKVRTGEAFLFTCPECGDQNSVDYGFLYHQMEDKIMIHYANSDENFEEMYKFYVDPPKSNDSDIDMIMDMAQEGYINRIVRSKNEVLEKIAIFDAGLDDRVIEICKLMLYLKVAEQVKSELVYALFYTNDEGEHCIEYKFEDNLATVTVTDEMYKDISEMFEGKFPEEREANIVINMNWALEVFKSQHD